VAQTVFNNNVLTRRDRRPIKDFLLEFRVEEEIKTEEEAKDAARKAAAEARKWVLEMGGEVNE
jgi:hypothetical protein